MRKYLLALFITLALQPVFAQEAPLPLPRFVSLRSNEVNVRSGPGTRYPILWVYRKEGLPVEITEEFEHWRKIRVIDGTSGWVHKGMLEGARNVLVKGKMQVLRSDPEDKSSPVLRLAPMVVGKLLECKEAWCRIQVEGRKGWIHRKNLWGVYENEEIKK